MPPPRQISLPLRACGRRPRTSAPGTSALAGGILVKQAANRALIYKPTTLANGTVVPAMAGWEFTKHPGFMEIKGSAPGFSAYLSRFTDPADLVCVTLLANKQGLDLTTLARDIADAYKRGLGAGQTSDKFVAQESKWSVDQTVARLELALKAQKVPVFAEFDHDDNARKADMALRPTHVLVFGNPKVGTKLMQAHPTAALDLPLRVTVFEDDRGRVWVGYRRLDAFAAEHGIKDPRDRGDDGTCARRDRHQGGQRLRVLSRTSCGQNDGVKEDFAHGDILVANPVSGRKSGDSVATAVRACRAWGPCSPPEPAAAARPGRANMLPRAPSKARGSHRLPWGPPP